MAYWKTEITPPCYHDDVNIRGRMFLESVGHCNSWIDDRPLKSEVKSQDRLWISLIPCLGKEIKGGIQVGQLGKSCARAELYVAGNVATWKLLRPCSISMARKKLCRADSSQSD